MDLCQNRNIRSHLHTPYTHTKNTFNRQNKGKYLAVSLISKSLRFGMAQWTFPKTSPRWNRRKDIWHHKGHIQRNKCYVKINDRRTDYFSQTKGVRQGCSLSPTLFNIYINELASALDKSSCPGLTLEGREIKCLLYADDLLLLSPHEEGLHQSLSVWKSTVVIGPYR